MCTTGLAMSSRITIFKTNATYDWWLDEVAMVARRFREPFRTNSEDRTEGTVATVRT